MGGDKAITAVLRKGHVILRAQSNCPQCGAYIAEGAGTAGRHTGVWVSHGSE